MDKTGKMVLAFLHIPKTAGTTVNFILRSSFGLRHCDVEPWLGREAGRLVTADDLRKIQRIYPRLRSIAGHRLRPYSDIEKVYPNIQYFTFLRNPIKRTISLYQHEIRTGITKESFENWIYHPHARNGQTRFLAETGKYQDAIEIIEKKQIFVGLVERFDESIFLLKQLICPDLNIAYIPQNIAQSNKIAQKIFDSEQKQLAIEANHEDIKLYDYIVNEYFSALKAHYRYNDEYNLSSNYNHYNVLINRIYRNIVYKPLLYIYRLLYKH